MICPMERMHGVNTQWRDGFRQLKRAGLRSFESAVVLHPEDTDAILEGFELRRAENGRFYAKHNDCELVLSMGPLTGIPRLTLEMTKHAQSCRVSRDLDGLS